METTKFERYRSNETHLEKVPAEKRIVGQAQMIQTVTQMLVKEAQMAMKLYKALQEIIEDCPEVADFGSVPAVMKECKKIFKTRYKKNWV